MGTLAVSERSLPVTNGTRSGSMMNQDSDHISTTRARAGTTPHVTRYVLGWGLGLVILSFLILLIVWL